MGWGIKTVELDELDELDKSNERKADRVINKRKEKERTTIYIYFFIYLFIFFFFLHKAIVTRNAELKRNEKKKKTESIENKDKRCRRNRCRPVRSFARL